jgi:Carboxypeptidase regulatory-like domain/TonB dependent receptor/TonB-dependent Receptor Plug Domain
MALRRTESKQEAFVNKNQRFTAIALLFSVVFLLGLLAAVPPAWGQQASGTITGSITDPSGAAVTNATVTARDVDRNTVLTTQTNTSGAYNFPQVTVGNIEVTAQATGFSKQVHPAFTLVLNQIARVDFQLTVGQVSQTVEVSTAPPILQTDSTEIGTVVNSSAAVALPLSTRNINQLTLLTPGVVSPNIFAFQAPQSTFGTGRPYVNGAREQDNNFSLDGMDTNQADNNEVGYVPSPDAIQEFNIIAGNASADFGNYIGGVVVETLKSGTNQFHGDIYEFLRNTDLNANTWQNKAISQFNQLPGGNGQILPRSPLQWNDFGATLGGPIIKNKLFFFIDFQGSLYNTPATSMAFSAVPEAFRTGDFSSQCTAGFTAGICNNLSEQLYNPFSSANPATRTPYLNNQVPILSMAAQNMINSSYFPAANTTSYTQHSYVDSWQGDGKVDWLATAQDHIMGRWSQQYVINNSTNSIALLPNLTREYPLKNFVLDYAHTFSPTLLNEFRVGFQDFPANDQIYTNPTSIDFPATFGIPGVPSTILPCMTFSGTACNNGTYTSLGSTDGVEIFHDTTIELEDAVTWTHGNHSVHFGFEYFHYYMNDVYPGNEGVAGSFSFSGQYTGNSSTGTTPGNGFADFLLGLPSDVTLGTPLNFNLRNSLFGGFVQDNWRVNSHLTLNLGLRYELTTPRGDEDSSKNVNFDRFTGEPQIGTNYNTYTGIDNFQPRIGFAYQPGWDWARNTVIRGAYGISTYMEGNGVNNLAVVNPPYVVNREANNTGLATPPFTLDQGYTAFPSAPCTAAGLMAFSPDCLSSATVHLTNPNLQPAVDQQWNLTIQRQLGNSTTVSAAYVGNKIDHMTDIYLLNQQILEGGVLSPSPFAPPLIAAGANVRYNDSSAIQRFNALELSLVERSFHGVQAQVNYTWSKCLSNSLGYFGQYGDEEGIGVSQTNGGYFFFQNIYDQKADYGRCISDIASAFNGYVIYDLPFGHGKQFGNNVNGVVNQIIGGWQVATAFNVHSGFAIDPSAPDQSGTGGGVGAAYRPNCLAGVPQKGSGVLEDIAGNIGLQFLNPAAVTLPAAQTFGNCGVGSFRGPGLSTADINITKNFRFTERFNLQFMTQFINFTNTPVFSAPTSSCSPSCNGIITPVGGSGTAGTFGLVQSANPGRQIQFGLKLLF